MRKIQFISGEYYHIYNRSLGDTLLFKDKDDHLKFFRNLKDFNNDSLYEQRKKLIDSEGFKELGSFLKDYKKIISFASYCLIPNHYHFILKQVENGGISNFMHKLGTSYTNYFNKKYERFGPIFQGAFKAIHINNNNYLLWLCGYINGNSEIHNVSKAENYEWSSFGHLAGLEKNELLEETNIITSQFRNPNDLKEYIRNVIIESKSRKDLQKYLLEKIVS